jgi:hypothetical protein
MVWLVRFGGIGYSIAGRLLDLSLASVTSVGAGLLWTNTKLSHRSYERPDPFVNSALKRVKPDYSYSL